MTAAPAPAAVVEPGVYDLPPAVYHADPVPGGSLSQSGAKLLLPPSCPARYAYEREHGREPTRPYEIGHAAHRLVLGAGHDIVRVERDSWRTNHAKEQLAAARDAGKIALLAHEHDQAQEMAAAVATHPYAGKLFTGGRPEQTLVWRDAGYPDVWRRALLDWLPNPGPGRMILPDYKTTASADPDAIERATWDYGYHIQARWYAAGVRTLGLAQDVVVVLVAQEKKPPYLVTVAEIDGPALRVANQQIRQAIDTYRQCTASGRWPGYNDDEVALVSLPPWAQRKYEETW